MVLHNNSPNQPASGQDLLSSLSDGVLGHILSFLLAEEAARAAILSRRWRYIFASIHTLSFVQEVGSSCWRASSNNHEYKRNTHEDRNTVFVGIVDAAFSCRRRCSGGRDPRLKFDTFHHTIASDVDRWLSMVMQRGGATEIHVDARQQEQHPCARELSQYYYDTDDTSEIKDESDGDDTNDFHNMKTRDRAYRVPRELYSRTAASVRVLCLGSCFLDLPPAPGEGLCLPSVETLTLLWIPDSGREIQRLVSACPHHADLTLDSCRHVRALTILDKRLRRLSLRCCHGARLTMDASELRALEYWGPVPDDSVMSFVGWPPTIVSCDVEFCGMMTHSDEELLKLTQFLERFGQARWFRLGSSCMGFGINKGNLGLSPFWHLKHLELKGALRKSSAIKAVMTILERAPNLEILTLLILPDANEPRRDAVSCDPDAVLHVPDALPTIPCLEIRVREINVVHYQGRVAQRMLLKQLLHISLALDELYVVFPKGKYAVQTLLMEEIQCWLMNRPVKVMFA